MNLDSLDIKALQSLRNEYEIQVKELESRGYTWQETYFLTSPISQQIKQINSLIERKSSSKHTLGLAFQPILGSFSTLIRYDKWKSYLHFPKKWMTG